MRAVITGGGLAVAQKLGPDLVGDAFAKAQLAADILKQGGEKGATHNALIFAERIKYFYGLTALILRSQTKEIGMLSRNKTVRPAIV